MTNPKAGHTSASGMTNDSQGLRDGDGLTSPSLTNLYEGLHGNGILRLGDGAKGDSLRNSIIANTPGFIETTATQGELKVYGGYCVLDGVLYKFANGPGNHETFVLGTTGAGANHSGDLPSVPASNSDVFVVVYLVGRNTPEAHLMYEMGTPAAPSSGTPLIPNRFLSNPSITGNTDLNHQTTVLAVLRYTMTGGAGSVTSSLSTTPTINDRRAFIRQSPVYLTPMTKGSIGNVDAANIVTDPDGFFPSPEDGDFGGSTFGSIWMSHMEDVAGNKHAVIYAATPRNLNTTPATNTHILGPDRLEVQTTTGNITFEFNEGNVWIITTDTNRTINPVGNYPVGHTVEIHHSSGAHTLYFDSTVGGHSTTPINVNIPAGSFGKFIYDGADWKQLHLGSTTVVSTPSSGASGLVQLSDGSGGFTSDSDLSWDSASNELTINGKLTVSGLIDPTGMVFTPQAVNPEATNPLDTIWINSEDGHLYRGDRDVESTVHFNVRNDEGATIPLGAPLYSKGEIGGSNRIKVGIADASDPNKMPAIGLAMQEMNTTSTMDGNMILTGILNENITITSVVEQDIIYVAPHGGTAPYLTITRPTSGSHLVQNIGVCVRQSATNVSQAMKVAAIGRTNDIPNGVITTNSADADYVYIDDGGVFKKITPANLGIVDAIAAVEGEATLDLTGAVTVQTDLKLTTSSDNAIIENPTADKDIIFKINDSDGGGASTEVMRIDGSESRVGIGTDSPLGTLHVKNSNTDYAALFESDDDGASAAPDVALYRNGLTPANGDDLGHLIWRGTTDDGDSTVTRTNITDIFSELQVAATGTESGKMHLRTKKAGTMNKRISIEATKTVVNEDGVDVDFIIESDNNANMFFVDAGNDEVGIGTNSPSATLDILTGGTFRNTRLLTVSVSASTTLTEAAHAGRYNICAGNITLPATSTAGEHYAILNTTGGDITIGRNGNNINGAASDFTLGTYNAATCIAIGSNNWMVVG